jgi:hypothetical protein
MRASGRDYSRVDSGGRELSGGWVGGEGVQIGADVVAQEGDGDLAEIGRVGFELAQGGGEEAGGADGVVALEMMVGDGDLDKGLEE